MNVYDFDKTIYTNDSSVDFIKYCLRKKPYLFFPYLIPLTKGLYKRFVLKTGKEAMKEEFFSILTHFKDREGLIREFWDTHEYLVKDLYTSRKRDDDLIISASPEFLIKEIGNRLGVKVLASPLDLKTLKYTGKNCHGKEKVTRYREVSDETIEKFYSDSLSDSPLAELAEKAFLVKGEKLIPWPEGEGYGKEKEK